MLRTDCCVALGSGQDLGKKVRKTLPHYRQWYLTVPCETETAPSFFDTKKINLVAGALIQKGRPRSTWKAASNLQLDILGHGLKSDRNGNYSLGLLSSVEAIGQERMKTSETQRKGRNNWAPGSETLLDSFCFLLCFVFLFVYLFWVFFHIRNRLCSLHGRILV